MRLRGGSGGKLCGLAADGCVFPVEVSPRLAPERIETADVVSPLGHAAPDLEKAQAGSGLEHPRSHYRSDTIHELQSAFSISPGQQNCEESIIDTADRVLRPRRDEENARNSHYRLTADRIPPKRVTDLKEHKGERIAPAPSARVPPREIDFELAGVSNSSLVVFMDSVLLEPQEFCARFFRTAPPGGIGSACSVVAGDNDEERGTLCDESGDCNGRRRRGAAIDPGANHRGYSEHEQVNGPVPACVLKKVRQAFCP